MANENYGYVFDSPDSGEEYSPNHPIKSGECPDAENVRPATAQEQTLYEALQDHYAKGLTLKKAAQAIADDACSYICPSTGKEGAPIPHSERCIALHAALSAIQS